ncbi:substrate-binding and VWA domain-containing protein [Planotetraspora sp. A-T 1434]|uniref:substrate-binding and VWA domain-containing protein n=1 Tax=Planotetraspora sp. A-T 1434 TaxID=2979219 RepID=UPI0021C19304|nr:substrate-binding and VWA domain-containing protein [Planotetraspora sp. A-T 1434]MCT9930888.1 substrate-binding and VWA domain-containing protein [Planotetraspora sp. A-T 1434]
MGGRHRTDELEGGFNPYNEPPPRRRASRGKVFVPLAGAVALAVLLGVAAYVVVNKNPSCGSDKIALSVVASPDIQPAVQKVAGRFTQAGKAIDGKCVAVTVKAADSADVANAMSGSGPTNAKVNPDIWVPDSSLWLAGLAKDGSGKPTGSAAHSPIVLTASKAGAEKLQAAFSPASWTGLMSAANAGNPDGLAKKVRVLALDPTQNAAGLGALLAGANVLKAAGGGEEVLVGVLRQLSESTVSSPDSLFATLTKAAARIPVGIASEQSVWAFNTKTTPSNPAVALYPAEGTVSLDYPIVITAKSDEVRKAAESFAAELTSASGRKTVQDYGFRTPDGKGGGLLKAENGVSAKKPVELPLPDAATVTKLAQAWRQIKLGTKLLALLDISGTMADPADSTGVSRMRAISGVAQEGLKLFPEKTEIGTWVFSDNLRGQGVDWKEVVPMGPLAQQINGVTRRDLIAQGLRQLRAIKTGNTGLNDTLWAAYQKMTHDYEADKVNTIILFTDGVGNDDPNGGISNAQILRKLKQAYDPKRPVNILIISFNTTKDENRAQMTSIAKATGGAAFFPQTVLEIRNIFLKGIARRLCAPDCGATGQQ